MQYFETHSEFEREVRASFGRQKLMKLFGATLARVEPGTVEISMPFNAEFTQHHGYLHAAVVTALTDNACGFAAMTISRHGNTNRGIQSELSCPCKRRDAGCARDGEKGRENFRGLRRRGCDDPRWQRTSRRHHARDYVSRGVAYFKLIQVCGCEHSCAATASGGSRTGWGLSAKSYSAASFSITTFRCAVTSLCSLMGMVNSPSVRSDSCNWILRRSTLKPFFSSASATSLEVTEPKS
jgi:hypothetical protein